MFAQRLLFVAQGDFSRFLRSIVNIVLRCKINVWIWVHLMWEMSSFRYLLILMFDCNLTWQIRAQFETFWTSLLKLYWHLLDCLFFSGEISDAGDSSKFLLIIDVFYRSYQFFYIWDVIYFAWASNFSSSVFILFSLASFKTTATVIFSRIVCIHDM